MMVKGMWGVVQGGGTAGSIRIPGFDIAGKTGTAQVAQLGKDVGAKKDHAWFVSFAPAFKPEIAVLALIENVGFGGSHAAPAVLRALDYELFDAELFSEPNAGTMNYLAVPATVRDRVPELRDAWRRIIAA